MPVNESPAGSEEIAAHISALEARGAVVRCDSSGAPSGLSFRPGAIRVSVRIAGNTFRPALLSLRARGYRLSATETVAGCPDYLAVRDGRIFSASNPVELLGLVALWESRGDHWHPREGEPGEAELVAEQDARVRREVREPTAFGDEDLRHAWSEVARLPPLRALDLSHTAITDAALALVARLVSLEVLSLCGTRIDGRGLAELRTLRALDELDLSRTDVRGEGLAALGGCPSLRVLWLDDVGLTDADVASLAALPALRQLGLRGTAVTDAAVAALRARLPALLHVERDEDDA